ncbi:MAG: MBL fold metallo-hydrolase [Alphaproteobacteria bacterium]|nr:MAG: MBL fold metallo-hydrolase [Alphaproteobacteria bacterium]
MPIRFIRDFEFRYETPEMVAPAITRVVARNPKDYTWIGTNTWIVGDDRLAIIDPGPAQSEHVEAVLEAIAGRPVVGIFITHSHNDHAPAALPLAKATGATIFGHSPLDPMIADLTDEDIDLSVVPDCRLGDRARLEIEEGLLIEAVHTPGHFPNHLCYLLHDLRRSHEGGVSRRMLFSGDHVMGWATTVIAPPLGNLEHYLDSLLRLQRLPVTRYLPSHGPEIPDGPDYVRQLIAHRRFRESQIVECLERGVRDPAEMVARMYEGLSPRLEKAAALSVQAHLDFLAARGLLTREGVPTLSARRIAESWPYNELESSSGGR